MKVFRGNELKPGDPNTFTGAVRTRLVASDDEHTPVHVYRVEFDSGGRTFWHIHSGPQWLLIVEGRVRVQKQNEAAVDIEAGGAVVIEPGVKHWHGAAPGSRGVHLAVNIAVQTTWLEPVSDADYRSG